MKKEKKERKEFSHKHYIRKELQIKIINEIKNNGSNSTIFTKTYHLWFLKIDLKEKTLKFIIIIIIKIQLDSISCYLHATFLKFN